MQDPSGKEGALLYSAELSQLSPATTAYACSASTPYGSQDFGVCQQLSTSTKNVPRPGSTSQQGFWGGQGWDGSSWFRSSSGMAPLWPPPPPALPQLLSRPILDTLGFQKVLVFPGHLSVSHLVSCLGPPATMTALGPEFFSCPASPEAGGEWSAAGCSVVASHAEFTSCSCNHTTNFAVLLQVYEVQVRWRSGRWHSLGSGAEQGAAGVEDCWGPQLGCFYLETEECRGGVHPEDPHLRGLWRLLLRPECHLHPLPCSRVRLGENGKAESHSAHAGGTFRHPIPSGLGAHLEGPPWVPLILDPSLQGAQEREDHRAQEPDLCPGGCRGPAYVQ